MRADLGRHVGGRQPVKHWTGETEALQQRAVVVGLRRHHRHHWNKNARNCHNYHNYGNKRNCHNYGRDGVLKLVILKLVISAEGGDVIWAQGASEKAMKSWVIFPPVVMAL